MKKSLIITILLISIIFVFGSKAQAAVFFDDFSNGPKTDWGNQRGSWYGHDGIYDTAAPSNNPITFSTITTLPNLTDFVIDVDIQNLIDGGIWLRTTDTGVAGTIQNGVLLVTGGFAGSNDGLYWHTFENGAITGTSPNVSGLGIRGTGNTHLKVKVTGNTYEAYVNGNSTAATTFTTNLFSSGKAGLYDTSAQTFDNFSLTYTSATHGDVIPEPTSLSLLGIGLSGLLFKKKSA